MTNDELLEIIMKLEQRIIALERSQDVDCPVLAENAWYWNH